MTSTQQKLIPCLTTRAAAAAAVLGLMMVTNPGLASTGHAATSRPLSAAYLKAAEFDATYAAATADSEIQRVQARMASLAYLPEARVSMTQFDAEASTRTTFSIVQPILNLDRWLALKESSPRSEIAAASLVQSRADLATRLLKSVNAMIEAAERQRLNNSTIDTLETQHFAARKAHELGQGTITDVRDTEVHLAQARSQTYALTSQLQAAQRQYAAIVGASAHGSAYKLKESETKNADSNKSTWTLGPLASYLDAAMRLNPAIVSAQASARLTEIGIQRSRAAFLPSLSAVSQRSEISGGNAIKSNYIGLRMDVPLGAASVYKVATSDLDLRKAQDLKRQASTKVNLDVERLHAQVGSLLREIADRRSAVQSAELSLVANENSFKGGVRSKIDVLNAIQSLQKSKLDHLLATLRLAESILDLHIARGDDAVQSLDIVQSMIFE